MSAVDRTFSLHTASRGKRIPPPSAAGVVGRKPRRQPPDGQAAETIDRIVTAAQGLLMTPGAKRVCVKDVCRAARISRGTLYRYFGSMDDILEALALRIRDRTDRDLRCALEGLDPPAQFEAIITFMTTNQEAVCAARLMQVEPLFVLDYLRGNFAHFIDRVLTEMGGAFDALQAGMGREIDREAITELLVRYVLSELMVPTPAGGLPLSTRLRPLVAALLDLPALATVTPIREA